MSKTKKKSIQYVDAGAAAEKATSGFVGKSVSLPEGFSFLSIKEEKEFRFRFAPYIVGKGNPEAPEGQVHYTRKYAVHGSVGGSEDGKGGDTYVCSRRVFNKPCAVCDYLGKLRQNPNTDPELLKALRVKDRQLFIVRDQANKDKGWQILDLSYHALGKQLEAKLKPSRLASSDDDEMPTYPAKHFFFLEGGASVRILFEVPKGMTKFYQAASIDIVPTKEVLPDDLLEKMPCLDDLLVETPYKVLEKILTEGAPDPNDDDEDGDDQPKAKAGKKKAKPKDDEDDEGEEDEDDDDEDDDDDTPEVKSKYKKGDVVKFSFKGKTVKGTVLAVNAAGMLSVKSDLRDAPHSLDEDEIEGVVKKGKDEPKPGTAKAKAEAKKKAVTQSDEDDDDDEEELKDDEDEDDIETDDDDEEDAEDDDEDEEEEKPKKKAGKSKKPEFSDDDEDDDDFSIDDDEDEEEEKPKKKVKK